jgi:hypothetical protein
LSPFRIITFLKNVKWVAHEERGEREKNNKRDLGGITKLRL